MLQKGYKTLRRHFRIVGVEVDLLMRAPDGVLTLVEVKSPDSVYFGVLSQRQKARLQRVQAFLCEQEPTQLKVLVEEGRVFLEIPLED